MLSTMTITPEQEKTARDQAFYLLKKYTSFTLLDKARDLYQGFLDAYAKQLSELPYPPSDQYVKGKEIGYKQFLRYMIPLEEGLHLLGKTPNKAEAYEAFGTFSRPIWETLFGRDAHEMGISYDAFFEKLGMTAEEDKATKPHTGFIENNVNASRSIVGRVGTTITHGDRWVNGEWHMAYNYYTLLSAEVGYNPYKYIYPFNFPKDLPPCPPHNTNSAGQVWSDGDILVTGIYEPWLLNGKVGCPNYFLAGQKAIEYQLEGTQDKETVSWRLLWEDKRYLDGSIPPEEDQYLREPQPDPLSQKAVLSAQPGQPCPQEGVWFAPHLQMKEVHMKQGEPMPAALNSPTGAVIWYLKR